MLKMLFSKKNWLVLLFFPLLSGCWLTSQAPVYQFVKEEQDTILAWYENMQNQPCILTEQANYCASYSDRYRDYKKRLANKKKMFFETAQLYIYVRGDIPDTQYPRLESQIYLDKRKYSAQELKNRKPYWYDADEEIKELEEYVYPFYKKKQEGYTMSGYYSEPHFGLLDYAESHKVPKQFTVHRLSFSMEKTSVSEAERNAILAKHKLSRPIPMKVIYYKRRDNK